MSEELLDIDAQHRELLDERVDHLLDRIKAIEDTHERDIETTRHQRVSSVEKMILYLVAVESIVSLVALTFSVFIYMHHHG